MPDLNSCQFVLIRMAYIADRVVSIRARSNVTFDISLHKVYVQAGVRYVMTKFSRMGSLPNFITQGAPLRPLRARESSAIMFFLQQNSSPLFWITRSSSFSVIHVSVNIKNNVEKHTTLLLIFSLSKSRRPYYFPPPWVACGVVPVN